VVALTRGGELVVVARSFASLRMTGGGVVALTHGGELAVVAGAFASLRMTLVAQLRRAASRVTAV
jgi:16S rRNA G1207 methylase RsmC